MSGLSLMVTNVGLLLFAAIGHTVLWVSVVNRVHGLGIRRKWVKLLTLGAIIAFAAIPAGIIATQWGASWNWAPLTATGVIGRVYIVICILVVFGAAVQRWIWARYGGRDACLSSNRTLQVLAPPDENNWAAAGMSRLLARLPGNQVFDVHLEEKELVISRLPPQLDGLSIAHLTDFHMSGRIALPFFERLADAVVQMAPDIIAITGDIVENDTYLDWIPHAMGRLRATHGVFYVLGNHDCRATESSLKRILAAAGLVHLGSQVHPLVIRNTPLILAGNELPWYRPAADLRAYPPEDERTRPTRILLAHSPDQFRWAQENDVDLMLAGHLHGGQIRLPWLGPFLAPSVCGVRYAAGAFTSGHTTLHVSRGVSSLTPIRYGCPPEVALLVLRSPLSREHT